jgi:hypothetical protein
MTYEEFEWHILRMFYEHGLDRIQPAYVAYAMGIPHEKASEYLDRAAQTGVLEMEVTEEGCLEYFVPGIDPSASRPNPIWQSDLDQQLEAESSTQTEHTSASEPELLEKQSTSSEAQPPPSTDGTSARAPEAQTSTASAPETETHEAPTSSPPAQKGMDGTIEGASAPPMTTDTSSVPPALQEHIDANESHADGSVSSSNRHGLPVVDRDASVHSDAQPDVVSALERSDHDLPIQIESTEETFSDPSQTIFMRQLRVEGVESEAALRQHVHRLFDSLGYQMVDAEGERMRFERGSVTFILALVPLFVLVLPLFVYLFLYCMGRSTIHQEPLELDVQLRKSSERDDVYDIDLTFIGLHGVVLGAADQRVLDKEVDTLRDELQWALTTG